MRLLTVFCLAFSALSAQAQPVLDEIAALLADNQVTAAQQKITEAIEQKAAPPLLLQSKQAELWLMQGKSTEAENLMRAATGPGFEKAVAQTTLGYILLNKGQFDAAIEQLQHAMDGFRAAGKHETKEAANALAHLSFAFYNSGKRNEAEEAGQVALQLREHLFGNTSEEVAASYNDLGTLYGVSNPDQALDYYEMAQAIYAQKREADHPKLAIAATNIGFAYLQLELYGDAVTNFETALAIWKKRYPPGHPNQALALVNLGLVYDRLKNTPTAVEYTQQAIALFRQSYGNRHPDIAVAYNQLGVLQINQRQYDAALASFQEALMANSPSFAATDIHQNPRMDDAYNTRVMFYSLNRKAQVLEARHYGKTLKLGDLTLALKTLQLCDALVDNLRQHTFNENDKIELGEQATDVYQDGVRLALAIADMSVKPGPYRELAFYFAEKSKSAVLQELIADTEAKSFAGIPTSLLEQEGKLKADIAFTIQRLASKASEDEEKKLRAQLFDLNNQYNQFTEGLEKNYPAYFDLKFNRSAPRVGDVQNGLDEKTAFISYFFSEADSVLYQFILTRHKYTVRSQPITSSFRGALRGFVNSMYFSEPELFNTYATQLSALLLPKLPSSVEKLILLPSANLGTIPFEALFYQRHTGTDFAQMPFAIRRYAVSYEFSAGLLRQKERSKKAPAPWPLFVCAPVRFPEKDQLMTLPGTEAEAKKLASLFRANATVRLFEEASEEHVKSGQLNQYRYLHFATHGIVDPEQPQLSRIFLQTQGREDGNLFAGEIYNLQLNAELTVLSACQTGLGKISKGEGVIGLSRALVYAGSRNNVVSFWSVADASTAELMTDFYTRLATNAPRDYATPLREAKLAMIERKTYASPYYWAPFVLIGK
ncbi:MAG: CHAT domain-containing protein [Cyclobacteriaceae bacterium]|jgi:Flp pilus assembly protein TadD|nr:CHAT domain-containing protein [Cyclobacteriaceae bacterium]